MTAIDIATLKDMAATNKRLTIHGDIHRVEKINVRDRTVTTRRGEVVSFDDIYKKGRGFFADPVQKGKKKKPRATEEEVPAPKTKPKPGTRRTQKDDDEEETKPTGRARNRRNNRSEEKSEPKSSRTRKVPRETDDEEETKPRTRRKRMKEVTEFTQDIAEKLNDAVFQVIREAHLPYSVVPVASGATYGDDNMKVQIVFMPTATPEKAIKKFLNDHRASTDIMPDDEQDDPLDELDDDDEDDTPEEDDEEDDPDDLDDDEEEDDGDDDEDDELEDDEDDDSEEEEDDEEEDDESDDEDEADAAIEQIVDGIIEAAPNLKRDKVVEYVNAYLTNDEIEDKVGDDLVPGSSVLTDKGKDTQFLLVGFDSENEVVKLLNTETQKYRNRSIDELVHMNEV